MKSPKFQFSIDEIKKCVNKSTLKIAWKKKLGGQLRKQIIIDLVEYKDFSSNINNHCQLLEEEITTASYLPSKPRHYLVEKSRGLCRQMTLGHPRDMMVLQALSSALQSDIKKSRPTKKAFFEPGEQKFDEKRLLFTPDEYGAVASWKRFQEAIFDFSKERNYIVITDVANFYDFINFNHLRNIIASLCDVKEAVLDFLIFILNEISWNPDFMPRTEIGLPQMELEAPRVLANAMLFELDKVANDHALGDYVRFMDDIDVGVDTVTQAKRAVRDIDLTLQARQLRLNASKTKILRTSNGDAARHFCIKENYFLDRTAQTLEASSSKKIIDIEKRRLERYFQVWRGAPFAQDIQEKCRFFEGNGEKIFKRTAKLLHFTNTGVPDKDLIWLIRNRPSLRSYSFFLLMHCMPANKALYEIEKILNSGTFIDDTAVVDLAKFMVHARFINNAKLRATVRRIVETLQKGYGYFGLYSSMLIGSKLLTPSENLKTISEYRRMWRSDYWLGRTVGGMMPVMALETLIHRDYLQLLQSSDNPEARSVYDFHLSIRNNMHTVKSLYHYAKKDNPTYPQGIFHAKSLIILSISANPLASAQIKQIAKNQPAFHTDPFYRQWGIA